MTSEEKKFAIDLLKSLDIGMCGLEREAEDYEMDLTGTSRKEVLKTVRQLMKRGYRYNEPLDEMKNSQQEKSGE